MCKSPVTPVRDQGMFRPPIRSLDWIHVFVLRISLVSHAQENESLPRCAARPPNPISPLMFNIHVSIIMLYVFLKFSFQHSCSLGSHRPCPQPQRLSLWKALHRHRHCCRRGRPQRQRCRRRRRRRRSPSPRWRRAISASGVSAAAPPLRRRAGLPCWSTSRCSLCASGAVARAAEAAPCGAPRGAALRLGAAPTTARGTATAAPAGPSGWRSGESLAFGGEVGAAGTCRIWDFFRRERCAGTARGTWAPPFQKRSCRETGRSEKVDRALSVKL